MTRKWDEKLGFEEDKGSEENHNQNNTNNVENNNATMVHETRSHSHASADEEKVMTRKQFQHWITIAKLLERDADKKKFIEELLSYTDTFNRDVYTFIQRRPCKTSWYVLKGVVFPWLAVFVYKLN
ncbi:uncharacterized protein LOC116120527 [Pistacia vera]|uniref:uncharacterized protein LOC116120527 n=1 Tax=Pistacia vera TaxID=55513 RepID=UPI001263AFB1|nr:uncharacterized protein LOC116120527 [Pistacia vera]